MARTVATHLVLRGAVELPSATWASQKELDHLSRRRRLAPMLNLLRFALLAVITLLLVSVVVGIATGDTGVLEKLVLAAAGVVLLIAASRVRRIGRVTTA
jgi:hypothetical protein